MAKNRKNDDSIIGGVIDQLSQIADPSREVAADFVETVSPDAAGFIRPAKKAKTKTTAREIPITVSTKKAATKSSASKRTAAKKAAASSKKSAANSKAGKKASSSKKASKGSSKKSSGRSK